VLARQVFYHLNHTTSPFTQFLMGLFGWDFCWLDFAIELFNYLCILDINTLLNAYFEIMFLFFKLTIHYVKGFIHYADDLRFDANSLAYFAIVADAFEVLPKKPLQRPMSCLVFL
jgi:hypothetical protein